MRDLLFAALASALAAILVLAVMAGCAALDAWFWGDRQFRVTRARLRLLFSPMSRRLNREADAGVRALYGSVRDREPWRNG